MLEEFCFLGIKSAIKILKCLQISEQYELFPRALLLFEFVFQYIQWIYKPCDFCNTFQVVIRSSPSPQFNVVYRDEVVIARFQHFYGGKGGGGAPYYLSVSKIPCQRIFALSDSLAKDICLGLSKIIRNLANYIFNTSLLLICSLRTLRFQTPSYLTEMTSVKTLAVVKVALIRILKQVTFFANTLLFS